ncbi:unnamed protein product [Gongylonema pulchrum]|uniref:CLASP_N domain-containing protein n=1 Tax=Gongylonema pulchrum TaxID=637853 RepID=A0A3P6RCN0_9BILA|nr:unnamed protein product [Gongylonema pulchrum]
MDASNLDASSVSLGSLNRSGSTRRIGSKNGRGCASVPQGTQQDLDKMRSDLVSNEWDRRTNGLKNFAELVAKNAQTAMSDTKLVEAFVCRTSDINSKVSLDAMEILITVLPTLAG